MQPGSSTPYRSGSMPRSPEPCGEGTISSYPPQPLPRLLVLAQRCLVAFPECRLSWGIVVERVLAQLGLQRKWAGEVRAIDDPLEQVEPLLCECLANDAPAKRRKILAAWRETHHRTESRAAEIAPDN